MDEILELTGRAVVTRFQDDRFSAQTLALVYQRLATETAPDEAPNRLLRTSYSVDRSALLIAEVMP
jgi:hypothetical protein